MNNKNKNLVCEKLELITLDNWQQKHYGKRVVYLLPTALLILLVSISVLAEDKTESYAELDLITVTAQKRPEDLATVPISVNTIFGETIEDLGMRQLEDLSLSVPSLTISQGTTNSLIHIRGIGSGQNQGYEQSVGLFVDGVYAGRDLQFRAPFLDVERVEVLKGPQGILFGKNTTAGAISIISAKPDHIFETKASAQYAPDHGEKFFEGVLSGSLFADLSARFAMRISSLDGYLDNSVLNTREPNTDEQVYRITLDWTPMDEMEVTLKHEYNRSSINGKTSQLIETGMFGPIFSFMDPGFNDDFDETRSSGGVSDSFAPEYTDTESHNTALTINYDIAGHILTAITGFSNYDYDDLYDIDNSALSTLALRRDEKFHQFSQEIRLSSPLAQTSSWIPWNTDALDYTVGFYYHYQDLDSKSTVNVDTHLLADLGLPSPRFAGSRIDLIQQNTNNWALFGQSTWHLRENLRLAAGLRYTGEEKTVNKNFFIADIGTQTANPALDPFFALSGAKPHHFNTARSESHLTPMVNLQWDVTEQDLLYFNFSTAAKGGGFDLRSASGVLSDFEFNDERATGFEIGAKTHWFDDTVAFDIALFRTDIEDLQVTTFDGFASFVVNNAAEASTQGVEVNSRWKVAEGLIFSASAAYLDAQYDSFNNAACTVAQTVAFRANGAAGVCTQDLSGQKTRYSPEWTANLNAQYVLPLSRLGASGFLKGLQLSTIVNVNFSDDYFLTANAEPILKQKAYTKVDVRIALGDSKDRWELAFLGKNLSNELTSNFGGRIALLSGSFFKLTERLRTLAVQARLSF